MDLEKKIRLSVVIPAYNEASRIEETLRSLHSYLTGVSYDSEVIIVLNNCSDKTGYIASEWKGKIPHLSILDIRTNDHIGNTKGYAIRHGLSRALGEYHLFMDADNATDISEIEKVWPEFEKGFDVVIGSRYTKDADIKIRQKFFRRLLSRLGNFLIRVLVLPGIKDTQCGFKAFTKKASRIVFTHAKVYGWGADIEMLVIAKRAHMKIKEIGIVWEDKVRSMVKAISFVYTFIELWNIFLRWKGVTIRTDEKK